MKNALLLIAAVALPGFVAAGDCSEAANATTPTHRFVVHDDATATDTQSGLRWARCPVGYALDNNGTSDVLTDDRCEPEDTTQFSWQDALLAAQTLNGDGGLAGFADWRVPNVKELVSIVEFSCRFPAINDNVFPGTVPSLFWSSTTYNNIITAAVVNFQFGSPTFSYKDLDGFAHYLRLVRND